MGKGFIRNVDNEKEYWVHVDYRGYRNAFLDFLSTEYNLPKAEVPKDWEVDHLLNKAFARCRSVKYIRVVLIKHHFNNAYGRTIEKRLAREKANNKRMYLLDYFIMMKILNIPVPHDYHDYCQRRHEIAEQFVLAGVNDSIELTLLGLDGIFSLWKGALER
jgi:Lhr-like helicase